MAAFAVYLYLFNEYMRPGETLFPGVAVMDILAVFTLGAWLLLLVSKGGFPKAPHNSLMLGLMVAIVLSDLRHMRTGFVMHDIEEISKRLLYYFWLVSIMDSRAKVSVTIWIMILFSSLVFVSHSHLQVTTEVGFFGITPQYEYEAVLPKWCGTFSDSNDIAMAMVIAIGLCIGYIMKHPNPGLKVLALGCLVALNYGAWISTSRGARAAMAGTYGSYLVFSWVLPRFGVKKLLKYGVPVALVGFLVLAPKLFSAADESARSRLELWEAGIQMVRNNPIVGRGWKQFTEFNSLGLTAHNSYVNCFAELGLLGYFCWLGSIYVCYKEGVAIVLAPTTGPRVRTLKALNLSLLCSMSGFLVAGYFLTRNTWELWFILVGLMAAVRLIMPEDCMPPPELGKKDARNIIILELASIAFVSLSCRLRWMAS